MTTTDHTDFPIRPLHDAWHKAIVGRNAEALMTRSAEDAVFETPQGEQINRVEVTAIANRLINRHRVYSGGVGLQALVTAVDGPSLQNISATP